jgi:hypothetical protein
METDRIEVAISHQPSAISHQLSTLLFAQLMALKAEG